MWPPITLCNLFIQVRGNRETDGILVYPLVIVPFLWRQVRKGLVAILDRGSRVPQDAPRGKVRPHRRQKILVMRVEHRIIDAMDETGFFVACANELTTSNGHTDDNSRGSHGDRTKDPTITRGEGTALCHAQQK